LEELLDAAFWRDHGGNRRGAKTAIELAPFFAGKAAAGNTEKIVSR
jgi:hypothetical protein